MSVFLKNIPLVLLVKDLIQYLLFVTFEKSKYNTIAKPKWNLF